MSHSTAQVAVTRRIDTGGRPGGDWLAPARAALDEDGAVLLTGTGLAPAAAEVADRMLADLPLLLPHEEELTVYARGHLRQYPPVDPDSRILEMVGNPVHLALCRSVLGDDCFVGNHMGHTVLPGADAQPVHADFGPLWPSTVDHPPYLLAYNVALVGTDVDNGSIEVWPGTHRVSPRFAPGTLTLPAEVLADRRAVAAPEQVPMEPGDVLVRDTRLWHRGTRNPGSAPRPIVFGLVSASWYLYQTSRPLLLPEALRTAVEDLDIDVMAEFTDEELDPVTLSVLSDD